jgi:hypothetical protein
MDIAEIIELASDIVERPDYDIDSALMRSFAQRAINQAHSLADFNEDKESVGVALTGTTESTTITLPADYRKLVVNGKLEADIVLLDANGYVLAKDFKRGHLHRKPSDYFGLTSSHYYFILGRELQVNWHYDASQANLVYTYYRLPQITYDSQTQTYSVDSFIADRYPYAVIGNIAKIICGSTDSDQFQKIAALAQEDEFALINAGSSL